MFTKLFNTDVIPLLGKRHFDAAKCIADATPEPKPIPGKPFFFLTHDGKMQYLPPEPKERRNDNLPLPSQQKLKASSKISAEAWETKPDDATHWDINGVCWRKPWFWWQDNFKSWSRGFYGARVLAQYPDIFIPVEPS